MPTANVSGVLIENSIFTSTFLAREVKLDFYLPRNVADPSQMTLLLINDGQDMEKLGLATMLEDLYARNLIQPILCVGIHASTERKMEYGTAHQADYLGRGAKAGLYTSFIIEELLPFIHKKYFVESFKEKAFAGFSLGGLMALDIVWNHPELFKTIGVFSGSLWWRNVDQHDEDYDDDTNRIMHQQIRNGEYKPGLRFFFTTGSLDETRDRNNNGVIDSIDDTLSLIEDLESLGYKNGTDIRYTNYEDGRHDVDTWRRAMPEFLKWGWSNIEN